MRTFLDTNVVVYAFDTADAAKQRAAIDVLECADQLLVSTQVLVEAWWTLTRKIASPLSEDEASVVLDELCRLPVVPTDSELVRRSVRTSRHFHIAIWDALIVEAARSGGCRRILSEDLQHGQSFAGVVVENPFHDLLEP